MSDPWSRPAGDDDAAAAPPPDGSIEIELDGPGHPPSAGGSVAGGDTPDPPEPNWRKVVGLSSLGGVVLGGIVAAVIFAGGDGGDDPTTSTTLDPVEAASRVTTPPTLPLFEPAAPSTTEPGRSPAATSSAPTVVTLPTYPDATDVEIGEGEYAFDLAYLEPTPPVETTITFDDGDSPLRAGVVYDPATDRYRLTDEQGADVFIVDIGTRTTFSPAPAGSDAWEAIDNGTFFPSVDVSFEQYLRALLYGPVRPDTVDGPVSVNTSPSLVQLEDGTSVRPFVVVIPASELAEWALLYGAPVAGVDPAEIELEYHVYVTRDGLVRRTEGINAVYGRQVLTRFDFSIGGEVAIDLPDPERVVQPDGVPVGDAEDARPRYPDASGTPGELPTIDRSLVAYGSTSATIVETTRIDGIPLIRSRTERDPAGRLFQTVDDFDADTRPAAQFDDAVTGIGYVRTGTPDAPWRAGDLGTDIEPIDPRFVDGLLSVDELAGGELVGSRWVELDDGSVAVEFELSVPLGAIDADSPVLEFVDGSTPVSVHVYAETDEPMRVRELRVATNGSVPVVWIQTFEYFLRDEFTPPTVSSD